MGLVRHLVGRVVKIIGIASRTVFVGISIHVLIAEHQLVGGVHVPVQAAQDVEGPVRIHVLGERLARVADPVRSLVMVDDALGQIGIEILIHLLADDDGRSEFHILPVLVRAVGGRKDVRVLLLDVFRAQEEEHLVLDDGTAHGKAIGLVQLGIVLLPFLAPIHLSGSGGNHVLVQEIGIERTLDLVGSRFGNSVDGAARKAALAHVEGCHHHLYLLNGIHRNRIGARLASVGSGSGQTEGVVGHGAVHLEGIVPVVGSGEGNTAVLVDGSLRGKLDHIVDAPVDGRRRFHHPPAETLPGPGDAGVERALAHHHHGIQLIGGLHPGIQFIGLAQFQDHILHLDRCHPDKGYLHRVRAAGAHTADGVATLRIGNGGILRTRRSVHGHDGGAGQRLPCLIRHTSAEARCRHLGKNGDTGKQRHQHRSHLLDESYHKMILFWFLLKTF